MRSPVKKHDRDDLTRQIKAKAIENDHNAFYERPIFVITPCDNERVNEKDAGEMSNIEEDFQGADVVTFVCAKCGNVHKSRRYG